MVWCLSRCLRGLYAPAGSSRPHGRTREHPCHAKVFKCCLVSEFGWPRFGVCPGINTSPGKRVSTRNMITERSVELIASRRTSRPGMRGAVRFPIRGFWRNVAQAQEYSDAKRYRPYREYLGKSPHWGKVRDPTRAGARYISEGNPPTMDEVYNVGYGTGGKLLSDPGRGIAATRGQGGCPVCMRGMVDVAGSGPSLRTAARVSATIGLALMPPGRGFDATHSRTRPMIPPMRPRGVSVGVPCRGPTCGSTTLGFVRGATG